METNIHFLSYLATFLHRMRNISEKMLQRKSKHFVFSNFFFLNGAIYGKMWGRRGVV
jgi:hypothetical protein